MAEENYDKPSTRRLRGYAFDPSLSLSTDTALINKLVYTVPWEDLEEGPVGEYIEVVDYDPTVEKYYSAINLDNVYLVAQDGLEPDESNPQFHQQMVYAVTMTTIKNFERALGRKIIWAPRLLADKGKYQEYVQRLRIYPHALRDKNAYYSPDKKALLFGYFTTDHRADVPGSLVFTCLSHDIIAHETTHAILDGMHRHYNYPSNPDVLAFHEAFADIVALFQHFTFPEVLKHQIAKTRGDLEQQNLLGELARQFGMATGKHGSLRNAIGAINPRTKKWEPRLPTTADYENSKEPHDRGSVLVAAVFEAFLTIYKRRVADLLRISTNGTGDLPPGSLHPDLVNRLAEEAAKTARHVLNMCIRALDYCPPVDITFGDYLRAIVTADAELVKNDSLEYRIAFIDSFKSRGIYPQGVNSLSIENILLTDYTKEKIDRTTADKLKVISEFLRSFLQETMFETDREKMYDIARKHIAGKVGPNGNLVAGLHNKVHAKFNSVQYEKITGLVLSPHYTNLGVRTSHAYKSASFQIDNLRVVNRVGPNGNIVNNIVFSMVQEAGVVVNTGEHDKAGNAKVTTFVPHHKKDLPAGGSVLLGGCNMIFDLDTLSLKYCPSKPLLDLAVLENGRYKINEERARKQHEYLYYDATMHMSQFEKYFGITPLSHFNEPFALLHQS